MIRVTQPITKSPPPEVKRAIAHVFDPSEDAVYKSLGPLQQEEMLFFLRWISTFPSLEKFKGDVLVPDHHTKDAQMLLVVKENNLKIVVSGSSHSL